MEYRIAFTEGHGVENIAVINFLYRENGKTYHKPEVYPEFEVEKKTFAPKCVSYCGFPLVRWHNTCFRCRLRREKGEPQKREVTVHVQYIPVNLPKWRRKLVAWLDSIAEMLMN